jgi:hypothetical protein
MIIGKDTKIYVVVEWYDVGEHYHVRKLFAQESDAREYCKRKNTEFPNPEGDDFTYSTHKLDEGIPVVLC